MGFTINFLLLFIFIYFIIRRGGPVKQLSEGPFLAATNGPPRTSYRTGGPFLAAVIGPGGPFTAAKNGPGPFLAAINSPPGPI